MKSTFAIIVFFIILVAIYPFVHFDAKPKPKTAVITSNFALYDIAHTLLDSDVTTQMLLKPGSDLHTFEPTPKDMVRIKQSDFFIYSTYGAERYLHNLDGDNLVDISSKLQLLSHDDDAHHHDDIDPHYWLSIDNMITLSNDLSRLFAKRYKEHASAIFKRNEAYVRALKELKQSYAKTLATCTFDTIIVNHNAYNYLAKDFGFKVKALSGLSSDAQGSAKVMASLSDTIREKGVEILFYDPFENRSTIEALAKESGAKATALNTLANVTKEQFSEGLDYITLMHENLDKLAQAMVCR